MCIEADWRSCPVDVNTGSWQVKMRNQERFLKYLFLYMYGYIVNMYVYRVSAWRPCMEPEDIRLSVINRAQNTNTSGS